MDVCNGDYAELLQPMLDALSTAHFVSLDLEFSGISTKNTSRHKHSSTARKQTLQQRYEEIKEAAEKYQVLQVGLTLVHEDRVRGVYIVRPFNIFLSPMVAEKLGIERTFSFQSSAVAFLLDNGFRMDTLFKDGVPYLSREEEVTALVTEEAKADRSRVPDIQLDENEIESFAFVKKARSDILEWQSLMPRPSYLSIGVDGNTVIQGSSRTLNNLQRRLVHQLVRAEFPHLVAVSKTGYMQILPFDKEREDKIKVSRMAGFRNRLQKQVGLRWFIEGLAGGDLKDVEPVNFLNWAADKTQWIDLGKAREDFKILQGRVHKHRTILAGHNLFIDLIYFYQTFFGKLPDRVDEFSAIIHRIFPMVIDTKYMATHFNDDASARSGLNELDDELKNQSLPRIESCLGHNKYDNYYPSHEAGYDSLVTARILIRLSAKLESMGSYFVESEDEYVTAKEFSDQDMALANAQVEISKRARHENRPLIPLSPEPPQVNTPGRQPKSSLHAKARPQNQTWKARQSSKAKTAFSHTGMFDLLTDDPMEEGEIVESANDDDEEGGGTPVVAEANSPYEGGVRLPNTPTFVHSRPPGMVKLENSKPKEIPRLMPAWRSDFWNVYGNKLRVNGTGEGICFLEG